MNELTHERCSELLRPYVTGDLDDSRAQQVRAHLAECEACALELHALEALHPVEVPPMTALERAAMRRAVRSSVISPRRPSWGERWGPRVAPALGAAALLVVIAIGVVSFRGLEDRAPLETSGGTDTFDAESDERVAGQTAKDAGGGGRGGRNRTSDADARPKAAAIEAAAPQGDTAANEGTDELAGRVAPPTVLDLSQRRFGSARFDPRALVPADARRDHSLIGSRLDDLASSAPSERIRDVIVRCARSALDASRDPLVVTYASYFAGDRVLLIGFVWVDEATGRLNYQLRGWLSHACDRPSPIYREGQLTGE